MSKSRSQIETLLRKTSALLQRTTTVKRVPAERILIIVVIKIIFSLQYKLTCINATSVTRKIMKLFLNCWSWGLKIPAGQSTVVKNICKKKYLPGRWLLKIEFSYHIYSAFNINLRSCQKKSSFQWTIGTFISGLTAGRYDLSTTDFSRSNWN